MDPHFIKYQALGNDYLVIDAGIFGSGVFADHAADKGYPFGESPAALSLRPTLRAICDRHFGIGGDGILVGEGLGLDKSGVDSSGDADEETFVLRIFNPDGSEAEKSGNGLRIFARHVFETNPRHPRRFSIATKGGLAGISILADDGSLVRVDMGMPDFGGEGEIIDMAAEFDGRPVLMSRVSMGNPHCVLRGLLVDESNARRIGPIVETDPRFPNRTNVQLLEVLARDEIRIEIWERGAGYTLSSGSSSCAAAAVARRLGLVDDSLRVSTPGGVLSVDFIEGRALLTGPVGKVCEGAFSPEFAVAWGLAC